jgi:hypothetical protein
MRRNVDGGTDTRVGRAPANVASHRVVDVGIFRFGFCSKSAVADMIWPDWQ